jgi:hypothetical protein
MSDAVPDNTPALVALYREFLLDPPGSIEAPGGLRSGEKSSHPWRVSFALAEYAAVDPRTLGLGGGASFHDLPDAELDAAIERAVAVEGPMHFDVLADRLLEAAEVARLGRRIRERLVDRCRTLVRDNRLEGDGPFLATPDQWRNPPHRDWRAAPEKTRVLDHVSDRELAQALFVAAARGSCGRREIKDLGIQRIGFERLTQQASDRLEGVLSHLVHTGYLQMHPSGIVPATAGLTRTC